jgi:hypothetical protein
VGGTKCYEDDEVEDSEVGTACFMHRREDNKRLKGRDNLVDLGVGKRRTLNLNSVNQLIFVMVKCSVLFEVRTEFFK